MDIIGIAGALGSRLLCLIFKSLEGNFWDFFFSGFKQEAMTLVLETWVSLCRCVGSCSSESKPSPSGASTQSSGHFLSYREAEETNERFWEHHLRENGLITNH